MLEQQISHLPSDIKSDFKTSIAIVRGSDTKEDQLSNIYNSLQGMLQILEYNLPRIERRTELTHTLVCEIDGNLNVLRQTILSRFDETDQRIIGVFLSQLNETEMRMTRDVIDAIKNQKLDQNDQNEIESIVKQTWGMLEEIQKNIADKQKKHADEIIKFIEFQKNSEYNARHRLVLTIPLIPAILNYTIIHEVQTGIKIKTLWERLKIIWNKIPEKSS
jgi:hypothetical protein